MEYKTIPDSERIIYDTVNFENVKMSYLKNEDIIVQFTLDPCMKASTRDWIGIYPAGWSSFESFIAYKWGFGEPINNSCRTRQLLIDHNDLISVKPDRHYQFVYVSQHLEIMGVSQFFQFCTPGYDDFDYSTFNKKQPEFNKMNYQNDNFSHTSNSSNSCNINLPDDLTKVYTVCNRCKQLFEFIHLHDELKQKVEIYERKNAELQSRVVKLESALENMKLTATNRRDWNEETEKTQFHNFVEEIRSRNAENIPEFPYDVDDHNNKEIFMKAVIGNQEIKIRELTKVICQSQVINHPVFHALPAITYDVVTVSQTDEKLMPEECQVNNLTDKED